MTESKNIKRNLIIFMAVAVMLMAFAATIIYAVSFSVRKEYEFVAATDALTVNAEQAYYAELNAGAQVNVTRTRDEATKLKTTAFDLIVFSEEEVTLVGYASEDFGSRYFAYNVKNNGVSEKCYIFKDIAISSAVTNVPLVTTAAFRVVAVPSMVSYNGGADVAVPNVYVSSIYGLRLADNQTYYNENTIVADRQIYANIFFISDFSIVEEMTLSVPAYLNLLYANISLDAKLNIKHSYSGLFVIDAIDGEFTVADTQNPSIVIDTPYAYYQTVNGVDDGIVQKLNNISDITDEQFEALCEDALSFALGRLSPYTVKSISLPVKYQNYDVTISYQTYFEGTQNSAASVFSPHGIVKRQSATTAVTVEATVTVNFKDFSRSDSQTVLVVGTSDIAVTTAFADMFDAEIRGVFGGDDDGSIYNFDRGLDIAKLAVDFLTGSGTSRLTVNAVSGGVFTHSGEAFDSFYFQNNSGNITYTKLSEGQPQGSAVALPHSDKIYLTQRLGSPVLKLEFDVNGAKSVLEYNIVKSKQDVVNLIENNMNTPFVSNANAGSNIYYLEDGILKNDSVQLVEDSMIISVADIEQGVIVLTSEKYEQFLADTSTLESLLIDYEDKTYFAFNDTQVYAVSAMRSTDNVYIIWQKFIFEDGIYADSSPYLTFRKIEIPSGGITGGAQYEEYMRGDYFGRIFSNISKIISGDPIGNLITDKSVYMNVRFADSSGNPIVYPYLKFKADYLSAGITETITFDYTGVDAQGGYSIYYHGGNGRTYDSIDIRLLKNLYFYIDINEIPITNTTVNFQVEFFYIDSTSTVVSINTETYSFIIPGIYRSDDLDSNLYSFLIYCINNPGSNYAMLDSSYDIANIEQYIYQDYLLADGVRLFLSLSATKVNIAAALGISIAAADTKGLAHLVNLTFLDLSGLTLTNLDGLGEASGLPLAELRLSDCGITSAMLGTKLAAFRNLTKVDLSLNQLTGVDGILYRTVTELNLSGQANLADISGMEKLYEIKTLDLSNNSILSFEPLRNLAALKSVKVYGNIVSDVSGNFGTGGNANISVYVQLTVSGVAVYADSTQTAKKLDLDRTAIAEVSGNNLTYLTLEQWNSALILNAIVYKGVQSGTPELPSEITDGSGVEYNLEKVLVADMSPTMIYTLRITSGGSGAEAYSTTVTRLFTITLQ